MHHRSFAALARRGNVLFIAGAMFALGLLVGATVKPALTSRVASIESALAAPPHGASMAYARASSQRLDGQIAYPAEVDEGQMNPLISCTFRSLTRCRAPELRGQVSCYALGYPLPGTEEFGAFRAAGR